MKFLRLLDENFERWLMFALYSHIVAIVFVEVIRRFVFSYTSIWAEETARYAFSNLFWIVASAYPDRSHIRIDIIFNFCLRRRSLFLQWRGHNFVFAARNLLFC